MIGGRLVAGAATLIVVSVLIFAATQVLPGNAAYAVLGHSASPAEIKIVEHRLHLDQSSVTQYRRWVGGVLSGNPGTSLADGQPVWSLVRPRLVNSAVLAILAGVIGSLLAVAGGVVLAARRDSRLDDLASGTLLAVTALPEFVVAIGLVILFATVVFRVLPGVSVVPPGTYAWNTPRLLVLPVAALVLIIIPYILRMTRAAMIEALESEYVETARLKGVPERRILFVHALPNAAPAIIQVVAITFLYLAGGIVIVENTFAYPGIGQGLVYAVDTRDIPTIQLIVLLLAGFYVVVNILADVTALLLTPRRRTAR
jgi:peptide/nickel transport system permease protein